MPVTALIVSLLQAFDFSKLPCSRQNLTWLFSLRFQKTA